MNSNKDNNEINLVELILVIWKGKWKVLLAIVVSIAFTHYYNQITKTKNFIAITEIEPITTAEEFKYTPLIQSKYHYLDDQNSSGVESDKSNNKNRIFENKNIANNDEKVSNIQNIRISKIYFLSLYREKLNEKKLFEDAIHKFNLIDASQFKDNKEYNEAVIKLASSIKIKTPFNYSNKSLTSINNLKNNGYEIKYSTIHFEYNDIEKWKSVLRYVDQNANDDIKKNLQIYYKRFQKILEQERVYQLEDLSTKIDNLIRDYDRKTEDHVLYLKEQSSIARKLGIAKNTIEVQTFGNQNALLSNVIADSPFYFRGFEAIDEEIFLITSRKNKKAFIFY